MRKGKNLPTWLITKEWHSAHGTHFYYIKKLVKFWKWHWYSYVLTKPHNAEQPDPRPIKFANNEEALEHIQSLILEAERISGKEDTITQQIYKTSEGYIIHNCTEKLN